MKTERNIFNNHRATRIKLVWRALRGRPIIYKIHFEDGIRLPEPKDYFIAECLFTGSPVLSRRTRMRKWIANKLLRGLDRAWKKVYSYL